MFAYHFLFIIAGALLLGNTQTAPPNLTKADIPLNIQSELKGLIEQTFSPSAVVRAFAARHIGEMHKRAEPAIPFLIQLLYDDDFNDSMFDRKSVVSEAQDALMAIGEPAIEASIAATKNKMKERRLCAIRCLGKLQYKYPRALDALLELLKDDNSDIRKSALISLSGCTDTRATLPLINVLNDDSNSDARAYAAECFQKLRDPRSVEPLIKALNIKDETPGEPGTNKILYKLMGFNDPVRRDAITALGFQRDKRAVSALLKIFQDPYSEEWDRHNAALSLGMIGDKSALPALYKVFWLPIDQTIVRSGAILAVAMFHDEKHVYDALTDLLLGSNMSGNKVTFELQISIVQAMAEYGDKRAVKLLLHIIDTHGKNKLAFWAAMSAVKLTDGAIEDVSVVKAIQNYKEYDDGVEMYAQEKRDSITKIAENGRNWRVQLAAGGFNLLILYVPLVIIAIVIAMSFAWNIRNVDAETKKGKSDIGNIDEYKSAIDQDQKNDG
jgi:HEAT repeat protein